MVANVVFVLADDFEDSEFRHPYDRLTSEGHEVRIASSAEPGARLTGKRGAEKVEVDLNAADVDPDSVDLLVIPGGYSPDKLRLDPHVVGLVSAVDRAGKPVGAICHAGSLLIDAGMAKGRRLTSWPSIRVDLVNAGADWTDAPLVVDGNLITARKPDDLDGWSAALVARAR